MPRKSSCFPTSNMVETEFSSVYKIFSKDIKIINICQKGDIDIKLTSIKSRIKKLSLNHQAKDHMELNKNIYIFSIIIDFIKIIVHFIIRAYHIIDLEMYALWFNESVELKRLRAPGIQYIKKNFSNEKIGFHNPYTYQKIIIIQL
ncbi:hypothetical protein A3Q56_05740 [Intoshia linei]|uniref:Uncharacterized protein n=1 Tax=Intoshia linei TaxID=1819745 RepID=A0A177AYT2_9BILA|nr:hypothetical protein A3Q56_05740 [Intoshia linei]